MRMGRLSMILSVYLRLIGEMPVARDVIVVTDPGTTGKWHVEIFELCERRCKFCVGFPNCGLGSFPVDTAIGDGNSVFKGLNGLWE